MAISFSKINSVCVIAALLTVLSPHLAAGLACAVRVQHFSPMRHHRHQRTRIVHEHTVQVPHHKPVDAESQPELHRLYDRLLHLRQVCAMLSKDIKSRLERAYNTFALLLGIALIFLTSTCN